MTQIDQLPENQWDTQSSRRHAYTTVRIRVGTGKKRTPIWVELPVLLHRKPPIDATITWAWIKIHKVGMRTIYELQLTLESESFTAKAPNKDAVAIDFGWRVKKDNIRVGYCIDTNGKELELTIPNAIKSKLEHCDHLRSTADDIFNVVKDEFVIWIKSNKERIPECIAESAQYIYKWRSHKKLAIAAYHFTREFVEHDITIELWKAWKKDRLASGEDLFATKKKVAEWLVNHGIVNTDKHLAIYLDFWRKKNRHLYDWETNQRKRVLRWRKHLYCNFASQLSKRYGKLLLEDFNLKNFSENSSESRICRDQEVNLHRMKNTVSPSELKNALLNAFSKERIEKISAIDSTRTCYRCGHVNKWEHQEKLILQCAGCNAKWDQDRNACFIFLQRFKGSNDDGTPGSSRPNTNSVKSY